MKARLSFVIALVVSIQLFITPASYAAFSSAAEGQAQLQDNDEQLIKAVTSKKNVKYIEAGKLKVIQLLSDDTQGLPHQRWMASLSNGKAVAIIYNLDLGSHVPIQVGDEFAVGGEFVWTNQGGLVHWTHKDPKRKRPDGYVYYRGSYYGN